MILVVADLVILGALIVNAAAIIILSQPTRRR